MFFETNDRSARFGYDSAMLKSNYAMLTLVDLHTFSGTFDALADYQQVCPPHCYHVCLIAKKVSPCLGQCLKLNGTIMKKALNITIFFYMKEDRICISASLSSFSMSISIWSGASIALIAFHSVLFPRRNREAWPAFSQVRPIPKNCVSFSLDTASLMTIFLSKALVTIVTPPFGACISYI